MYILLPGGSTGHKLEKKGLYQKELCARVCVCVFISVFMCLIVHWGGLRAQRFCSWRVLCIACEFVCVCVCVGVSEGDV